MTHNGTPGRRRGVILPAVLVVVVILTLLAYRFLNLMTAEHEAAVASNRVSQGRYLADSGLHYVAFLLANPQAAGLADAEDGSSMVVSPAAIYDNPGVFHYRPVNPNAPGPRSMGYFSVVAARTADDPQLTSSQPFRFGVEDEGGKLNLNALLKLDPTGQKIQQIMGKLPNVDSDSISAVLNWMKAPGSDPSGNGDAMFYSGYGYAPKYGPYESLEELLLIKGLTPRLVLGNDRNRNGILDPEENDGSGAVDQGLSRYLTVYSRERNVDATGQPRVWINDGTLDNLETNLKNAGVSDDLITFILAYRMYGGSSTGGSGSGGGGFGGGGSGGGGSGGGGSGGGGSGGSQAKEGKLDRSGLDTSQASSQRLNKINSLFQLIDAEVQYTPKGEKEAQKFKSPLQKADPGTLRQVLPILFDKVSTTQQLELTPRININTAPADVLRLLPSLTDADVQNILDHRPGPDTDPSLGALYRTPAWLVTEAGFEPSVLQQFEQYFTTRSQVYRVQVVGYYEVGGPAVRLEAVIDTNGGRPRFLYWRDLTPLGRGFDLRAAAPQP